MLCESLADWVPSAVETTVDDGIAIDDDFRIVKLTVTPDSDLGGQTFGETRFSERSGTNMIGIWSDESFVAPPESGYELKIGTRLLVAGEPDQLDRLRAASPSAVRPHVPQDVLIAGFGDSGQAAYDVLSQSSSQITVLDAKDGESVDIVGDARDPAVLEAAEIEDISALVLTVGDDTTAIFATLIAYELNPDLHVIVRANGE